MNKNQMSQWTFCLLCISSLFYYEINFGTGLLLICAFLALPFTFIKKSWEKCFPKYTKKIKSFIIGLLFVIGVTLLIPLENTFSENTTLDAIPSFDNHPYVIINNNIPEIDDKYINTKAYEFYSELDMLDRCGRVIANICVDLMPTQDRESISHVYPSGWENVKYDDVDGGYLYNRCHLIGFQLSGENANEKNLITGTRYMNVEGMLPFENAIAEYVRDTNNHVVYEVTPHYSGNNLVASGVQMEAYSVEDEGLGISFNIYVYNNQPGIEICYVDGTSSEIIDENDLEIEVMTTYVINLNNNKFHYDNCSSVKDMSKHNKKVYAGDRSELIKLGYSACSRCNP